MVLHYCSIVLYTITVTTTVAEFAEMSRETFSNLVESTAE